MRVNKENEFLINNQNEGIFTIYKIKEKLNSDISNESCDGSHIYPPVNNFFHVKE